MGIPDGAQISDDQDHYLDGEDWKEIDHDSAVQLTQGAGAANWHGDDARMWKMFMNAALQGTVGHAGKPAAKVRAAGVIADHCMRFWTAAGAGLAGAIDEVKNDPNASDDVKLQCGTLSTGDNSTWLNAFITSLGTIAGSSTDPESVAKQTAQIADEALKADLGQQYHQIWDAYDKHRKY